MQIKALACELPSESGLPFSHYTHEDIAQQAAIRGIVASISGATVWRWLKADAIKPWHYRSWIFPRDPQFAFKAGRVLDLYQGLWEGQLLGPNDFVISDDEKTGLQARKRIAPTLPPGPGRAGRVEFEYERHGVIAYMAAWDVRRAKVFGLCERTTGIESYHHLVDLVMRQEPYRSAHRVFWITDNGSSHIGTKSIARLAQWYPNAIQVHLPVHASWLNQVEIYFSIVSRKVLTPDDFADVEAVKNKLLAFQAYYETIATPFEWKFTRSDLSNLLAKLGKYQPRPLKAAA